MLRLWACCLDLVLLWVVHKFCRFHELKQNPVCKIHNDLKMQQQLKEHRLAHEEHVWLKGDAAPRRPEEPENKHLLCSDIFTCRQGNRLFSESSSLFSFAHFLLVTGSRCDHRIDIPPPVHICSFFTVREVNHVILSVSDMTHHWTVCWLLLTGVITVNKPRTVNTLQCCVKATWRDTACCWKMYLCAEWVNDVRACCVQ